MLSVQLPPNLSISPERPLETEETLVMAQTTTMRMMTTMKMMKRMMTGKMRMRRKVRRKAMPKIRMFHQSLPRIALIKMDSLPTLFYLYYPSLDLSFTPLGNNFIEKFISQPLSKQD